MQTTCKDCIFAILEDGIQMGCKVGKLDLFLAENKAEIQEDGIYLINSFCKTARSKKFLEKIPEGANPVDAVLEESDNKYCAIISHQDTDTTLKIIKSLNVLQIKEVIVISQKDFNENDISLLREIYRDWETDRKSVV